MGLFPLSGILRLKAIVWIMWLSLMWATFDQPTNAATLTTLEVMEGASPITHVYHDEWDHGRQFYHNGEVNNNSILVVSLGSIVSLDPTVLEIGDLPAGWLAFRKGIGYPWVKMLNFYGYFTMLLTNCRRCLGWR